MNIKEFLKQYFSPAEANFFARKVYYNQLLNISLSRSSAASSIRTIVPHIPQTWEFSGFSQNGEDGIIQYLHTGIKNPNRYFIEIGSGNGLENNTSYLSHVLKFSGLQIEGKRSDHEVALKIKPFLVESCNLFVKKKTINAILQQALHKNPDVFSIDIDGMDFYILKLLLEEGLLPKIIVVEYNSAFGAERSLTLPYDENFNMYANAIPYLYYGVSLQAWKKLLSGYEYKFVTVESNGVNAFFIHESDYTIDFLSDIVPIEFSENGHQLRLFKTDHIGQFEKIKNLPLVEV